MTGPRRLRAAVLRSDREILEFVRSARPDLVVIDAPLSLPRGRRTIEDRSGPHLRECDRELLRRKVPFFPLTLGPMRMLTVRGMTLAKALSRRAVPVLEGYPGGSQDLLGWPRKRAGTEVLQRRLRREGLGGDLDRRPLTHDELDAVTIAWVGWNFRRGDGLLIGDPTEGLMLLPEPSQRSSSGPVARRRAGSRRGSRGARPNSQMRGGG
jgi:predicted nuclease with RNAse H fold